MVSSVEVLVDETYWCELCGEAHVDGHELPEHFHMLGHPDTMGISDDCELCYVEE